MGIIKTSRIDEDFYRIMGPVFGSRAVERQTHDRFYDDPGKIWYLLEDRAVASVLGSTIKNFWAVDAASADALLREILSEYRYLDGIVPAAHENVFCQNGFETAAYRKNFIEVQYEKRD